MSKLRDMPMSGGKPVFDTADALTEWIIATYLACKSNTGSDDAAFRLCSLICEMALKMGENGALDRSMLAKAIDKANISEM
jgi:hypothetical protein